VVVVVVEEEYNTNQFNNIGGKAIKPILTSTARNYNLKDKI
jgi:hypothetical protein